LYFKEIHNHLVRGSKERCRWCY